MMTAKVERCRPLPLQSFSYPCPEEGDAYRLFSIPTHSSMSFILQVSYSQLGGGQMPPPPSLHPTYILGVAAGIHSHCSTGSDEQCVH